MPRIRASFATVLLLCGLGAAAHAKVNAVVVRWGEVAVEPGDSVPAAEAGSYIGRSVYAREVHYLNWADSLPATLCRGFGVELWLTAGPGETVPPRLTMRMRHPPLTRPDGVSEAEFTSPLFVSGAKTTETFTFDEPWEAQPGEWSMEFLLDGKVLASKTFTVTPVEPGQPRSACPDVPQS